MNAHSSVPRRADGRPLSPREERRRATLKGWLVRDGDQSIHDFVITNLSYGGCRVECTATLQCDEQVQLTVSGLGKIDATVQWQRDGEAGLAFVAHERAQRPRQVERLVSGLSILVRRQGRRCQWLDGRDISPLGCCLEFVDEPRVGDRLWVQLPGLEAIEGHVRWVEQHRAGIQFDKPIHPAVYDLLLDRWKREGA